MTAGRRTAVAAIAVLLLSAGGAVARGDEEAAAIAVARAKAHNAKASMLFNLGRFREAAREYEAAYQARPTPVLLYNLAQCYLRLGGIEHLRAAAHAFEGFLRGAPNAPNRAAVEVRLGQLRQQIEREGRRPPASRPPASELALRTTPVSPISRPSLRAERPATAQPAPAAQRPVYKRWWFWTIIGGAVAAGVTGLAVGLRNSSGRVPTGNEVSWGEFRLGGVERR